MNISNKNKREDFDDKVSERYEIIEKIGKGSFGIVYKALDKQMNKTVAIKKSFDVFQSKADSERLLREFILINHFKEHPNVIKIFNIIKSENGRDLYIISEYFPANLFSVTRAKILSIQHVKFISYQLLKLLKYIHSAGIVHRYLKPSSVLLTSNSKIKLDDFSLARSIYSKDDDYHLNIADYIAIRWYRPPEVLLGAEFNHESLYNEKNIRDVQISDDTMMTQKLIENLKISGSEEESKQVLIEKGGNIKIERVKENPRMDEIIDKAEHENVREEIKYEMQNPGRERIFPYIQNNLTKDKSNSEYAEYCKKYDVWSVGCIIGEMLCGKTVFPGSSTLNQLNLIIQLVGFPSQEDINQLRVSLTGLLESIKLLQKIQFYSSQDEVSDSNRINRFKKFFPEADEEAIDLLTKLLTFNPYKRISVDEALEHPFLKDFRNVNEEIIFKGKIELEMSEVLKNKVIEYRNIMQKKEKSFSSCYSFCKTKSNLTLSKDDKKKN